MNEAVTEILDSNQPAPAETPKPTEVAATNPDTTEKISPKLEILIKREREALNLEQRAKQKELEIEAKLKSFEERENRLKKFESVKTNPKLALEELGLTYDELVQSILADGQIPPEVQIKKVKSELEQRLDAMEADKKLQAEEAKKREEAQLSKRIEDFKAEITKYLSDNKERYEYIDFEGQQELVFEVIDEHYNRTGKILSESEAADMVEKHLEEKYQKASELSKTKAIWAKLPREKQAQMIKQGQAPFQNQKPTVLNPAKPVQTAPKKTLTNNLSATPSPAPRRPRTDQERIKMAVANVWGQRST